MEVEMKRFLVGFLGIILILGMTTSSIRADGKQEKADRWYAELGISATYTDYTKNTGDKSVFHFGLIFPDSKWTKFVEARVNFYKPLEFSLSTNRIWWLYRKRATAGPINVKYMYGAGIFAGIGLCNVQIKEDLYAKYMVHIGFKIILKRPCSFYLGGRVGKFLDENIPRGNRNYASLSFGVFI